MKKNKKWIWAIIILSPVILYLLYVTITKLRGITAADITAIMPVNKYLAFLLIMALYGVKSLTIFFPIVALNIAVGAMYPLKYAFLINLAGSITAVTVPYLIGVVCKETLTVKLKDKYKNIQKLEDYRSDNQVIFTYVTRAVGFLPCDILSWYMGNVRMNYFYYLIGSLLGMLPAMILNTIFGEKLKQGITSEVIIFAVILFGTSFLISFLSNKMMKKLKK